MAPRPALVARSRVLRETCSSAWTASTRPGGRVMSSGGRVNAAVVQAAPVAFDIEATLAKVERLTAECAGGGADLVVFPEAFVSCYPRGLTFGTTVGSRTAAERLVWGMGDGSTLPVFQTPLGRLGAVICWENYMPLLRMSMYAKGIQLWCAPTADSRDSWVATMQHIACEGRCFVLSANQFVRRCDYPQEYPIEGNHQWDAVLCRGASMIVSPLGEILAG